MLRIDVTVERWPLAGAFTVARGSRTHVDLVLCEVRLGRRVGKGEGAPIYYAGETAVAAANRIMATAPILAAHDDPAEARARVQHMLPPGAARNALDCALWNLEAKLAGRPLWDIAGLPEPRPLETAFTISLGDPAAMRADAEAAAKKGYGLLKLKLTGEGDGARVAAVREGAPDARLIADANGSWHPGGVEEAARALADHGVILIEQPVPPGDDGALSGLDLPVPLCADESVDTADDIERAAGLYAAVNVKLDKAGGLTAAIELADAVEAAGLKLMVGCMLNSSLGIAPAFALAQRGDWADLDGPALLAKDRAPRFRFSGGRIMP